MTGQLRNNVSVVIVNYGKIESTVISVDCALRSHGDYVKDIVVVDNGSEPDAVARLERSLHGKAEVIPLGTNRYFGEGNNIGVEAARGDYILLLNNDAYVEPGCIAELARSLEDDPSLAAVGPMFLYPNGSVQEVGGIAMATGNVVQVGKGALWGADHYTEQCFVDYCSAACLLMKKQDFVDVGGFALQWEPAYYEDVDLCLMFWRHVGPVAVNPLARVVHLESLTTSDAALRLESQVSINRLTFVEKWGAWLKAKQEYCPPPAGCADSWHVESLHRQADRHPAAGDGPGDSGVGSAVLYTPYELIPGGGERVLFELASILVERLGTDKVRVAAPYRYSDIRTRQLSEIFEVNAPGGSTTLEGLRSDPPDMTIVLGNEIVPPIAGLGRRHNIYVCQFPFGTNDEYLQSHLGDIETFDEIWVYSNFVQRYVSGHLRLLGVPLPAIRVIYPPATIPTPVGLPRWRDRAAVLTVGRFFKGGHNKRQDVVIEILRQLAERFDRSVPLVIAGSLHATPSRDRFRELVDLAQGLDCRFYPNAAREQLNSLYANASILVHAAGYGVDSLAFPERLEHFGITPIEAASVGCIPVVYGEGGPVEVMELLGCPTTFHTVPEAVERINGLLADRVGAESLSGQLIERSQMFSRDVFRGRILDALAGVCD